MCRVKVESCLSEVRVLVWGIQSILERKWVVTSGAMFRIGVNTLSLKP